MAVLRRKCDQIVKKLGLSYSNTRELNNIIDKKLPGCPPFKCQEVVVDGQVFDIYFRDVIACVHGLFGDPEFSQHLKTAPECHYLDPDKTI
jgi:Plavaka transposase